MSETAEERIAEAQKLREENIRLQEEIDDNELEIERLLDIHEIPYDVEAQIDLLRAAQ